MQQLELGRSGIYTSRLVYGCMRIAGEGTAQDRARGVRALHAAIDEGYTQFDHADIYGDGACESLFGEFLKSAPQVRERILITSKCGIRKRGNPDPDSPGRYDFSRAWIVASVEDSLQRLGVDRLDVLLLHRPDYLMRADEVAAVFDELHAAGKVAHFGVSNFSPSQVALLQSACDHALVVNQVQINLHNISALEDGTLDQCQRLGITPQAWSPIAGVVGVVYPALRNAFDQDDEVRIRRELQRQQETYGSEDWIIALAWLLRHPAGIAPIIGSTTPARIAAARTALDLDYSREDWYRLLEARNGAPVP